MPPRPAGSAMAALDRDVEMGNNHYSSSPELSSLPSESPSEPGSPSRGERGRTSLGHRTDEIVVDASAPPRFALAPQHQPQQRQQTPQFSADGVRLRKDGVPRKKPGRKPGQQVKKAGDGTGASTASGTAAGSGVEAPKVRKPRKSRDPNAPPARGRKKIQPAPGPAAELAAQEQSRSASGELHFQPKVELTSMRMDIDPTPAPPVKSVPPPPSSILQPPRQPPLTQVDKLPKRESGFPSSMKSILNADDSPPRPPPAASPSTTPVRSTGQNYDPIRSSTYDPIRETMRTRDPYGTGPLGSPRAPSQMPNRASASPSIASLVDPTPVSISRSPVTTSSVPLQASPPPYSNSLANGGTSNSQHSRYRENFPSHPSSPSSSPAIQNIMSSSSSSSRPQSNAPKAASSQPAPAPSSKPLPPAPSSILNTQTSTSNATSTTAKSVSTTSGSGSTTTATTSAKTTASAKSETNGHKSHNRPPPPPPVPASTKSASSKTSAAKSTTQKSSTKAAQAAQAAESNTSTKSSGPITTSFRDVAVSASSKTNNTSENTTAMPLIKKFSSILQQERGTKQNKAASSAASSPKLSGLKDDASQPADKLDINSSSSGPETQRSILDFGKVRPGEEAAIPSIVLHVPLIQGENNKYVNFMQMAEKRYGWDALHPRLAAHRDRKARIAAASAALERNGSGRESGDEMTDDMQSGDEGSNEEGGATADKDANGVAASGPDDAPAKPVKKKRIFKEDEYDKDDDFVDDSEMLWEEQAAASRDGFFVYSGPLVPEEEKPAAGAPPAKRGRGSRGGRGGASRSTASRTTTGRATGPGSRGGTTTRKPRITKQEKEQREREKAEQEKEKAGHSAATKLAANSFNLLGTSASSFSAGMAVDA